MEAHDVASAFLTPGRTEMSFDDDPRSSEVGDP
jgi:hypothetical protein